MQWPEVSANPVARYHVIVFQNMLNEKTEARFEILLINQSLMIGLYFALLASEYLNSKQVSTMYFLIFLRHFISKIALLL